MALNTLQLAQALQGAAVPHVRHLFEICYKLTWTIKKSYDSDFPMNQPRLERSDIGERNRFRSIMLFIVENLCICIIQLLLAHAHLRLDLIVDIESGYLSIILDILKR
jgi:hypothetical protein